MARHTLFQLDKRQTTTQGLTLGEWGASFVIVMIVWLVLRTWVLNFIAAGTGVAVAAGLIQVWLHIKGDKPDRFVVHFLGRIFEHDSYPVTQDIEQVPLVIDPDVEVKLKQVGSVSKR